ncbi:MAG: hypothetical protein GX326_03575 [Clostridiaceae bacterium]|nr:hypothetical protein [Clostridiaceae bacterium]
MTKKQITKYYIGLLIFVIIFWLIELTPINLHDKGFFIRLIILAVLIILPFFLKTDGKKSKDSQMPFENIQIKITSIKDLFSKGSGNGLIWVPILLLILFGIFNLSSSEVFRSKDYAQLLELKEADFSGDIAEIDFTEIPTVDRETAQRLGSKKMGEIAELVSQFEVEPDYVQINFQGRPVRVTPLRYGDFIKWLYNRGEGLPRIIRVDMIDSSVELQTLPSGMKYSNSEPLFRNIKRHLRLKYPFDIMEEPVMEIDEEGIPYWVAPVIKPQIGWFGGRDVVEVILCNALTGETTKYKRGEIPAWIDRAFPAEMILRHINYYGQYQDGFINSFIGQKGVLRVTDLYNYLAINDDVYLFTGITSVSVEDNSNLGFVLVNLRTKETNYYAVASADESSAMRSAEGAVQEKGYTATVPILLNIGGRPTYCMALKDQASLVKMYALVDAQNYQTTGVGPSIKEAMQNYEISQSARLINEPETEDETTRREINLSGKIKDIQSVIIEGNTYYYFILDFADSDLSDEQEFFKNQVFSAPISLNPNLAFLEKDDTIDIGFFTNLTEAEMTKEVAETLNQQILEISEIEIK